MEPLLQALAQALGIKSLTTSAAGLIGGLLSLRFFTGLNAFGKVSTVLGGWACANYGTPVAVEFYQLKADGYHYGVAFAIGLFGMALVGAVFEISKKIDWIEVLRKTPLGPYLPGGGNDGGKQP